MGFVGSNRSAIDPSAPDWAKVNSFYDAIRWVAQVKYGTVLTSTSNRKHYPSVSEPDWAAIQTFDLFESVLTSAGATTLDALDRPSRQVLWLATLACADDTAAFEAAAAQVPPDLARPMRGLHEGWQTARTFPVPRHLPGESTDALVARINRRPSLGAAYEEGRQALISGRFTDNATQLFLLPYAVQRHRALCVDTPSHWRDAPGFDALGPADQKALGLMHRTLCAADDVLDVMDEVLDEPPNGDLLLELIKEFHVGVVQLSQDDGITADLPGGQPGSRYDMRINAYDYALRLFDGGRAFYAARV